jgi:ProP effector
MEEAWHRAREQSREAQELRRARSDALLLELRTRWPVLFTTPVPLAIGIDGQIRDTLRQEAAAAGTAAPSWSVLKNTMAWWTKQPGYREALATATHRVGLDGQPAGEITDRDRQHARERLAARPAERDS